jgi:hypothetical protein
VKMLRHFRAWGRRVLPHPSPLPTGRGNLGGDASRRSAFGATIRELWGPGSEWPLGVSAYEQVTRERVDGLKAQVDRIELKINGLLVALVAAVIGELYRLVMR